MGELTGINAFTLRGVETKVEVKIQGTTAQMAGMVAANKAGKLFDFMSQGEKALTGAVGVVGLGLADKASAATKQAREGLKTSAASGDDCRVLEFSALFDIEKVAGIEAVKVTCTSITSDTDAINKIMSLDMMKKYVETAISQKASQAVTDWQNQTFTLDAAKSKGAVLVASGVAMGGELIETGKATGAGLIERGSEAVETAKARAVETAISQKASLVASGVAMGGELIETGKAAGAGLIERGSEAVETAKARAVQGLR